MNIFDELVELKSKNGFLYQGDNVRVFFAPDLGARVFCELNGLALHRIDMENIRRPNKPFNNYGGNSFWPAPEGGEVGFNYKGDEWYVQSAINNEPFELKSKGETSAEVCKQTVLVNRQGIKVKVMMERKFTIETPVKELSELKPTSAFAYTVDDHISVLDNIKINQALIACWTLEQFDAGGRISFVKVQKPQEAINFDYYDDPREKITYQTRGFFYNTDSRLRGQIGIKKDAGADFIGFYDLERKLICIRQIVASSNGLYFNIADNEQPRGRFSAADNYSIFNGDESFDFFELETFGCAEVQDDCLQGSRLSSKTSFAQFETKESIQQFLQSFK
jgi:hypothetical protein